MDSAGLASVRCRGDAMALRAGQLAAKRSVVGSVVAKCTPSDATLSRVVPAVVRPLYRVFTPVRVEGIEHLPNTGPVIVAANHISFYDTVVLMFSSRRRVSFVGKAEYLNSWTTRRLFPALGLIPIERDQARQSMAALGVAAGVLTDGHALGIYPEGTR